MNIFSIGLDSGTQGTKAVLVSQTDCDTIAEAYAPHTLEEAANGKREQNPTMWVEAAKSAINGVLKESKIDPKNVVSIGVSGQQHGFVPLDSEGKVIRDAKLWCDTETNDEVNELTELLGGESGCIDTLGNCLVPSYTLPKILWLKKNEPQSYEKLSTILLPHDYLNFWMTGERCTEFGDASGTAYFDVRTRKWSPEVLNSIDPSGKLETCLPRLVEANEPIGKITSDFASEFGFSTDVIVSAGGGDNMMAAIGTGNVEEGVVTASVGTSGTIYAFSKTPVIDSNGALSAFCSSDGNWLPLICTMNATISSETMRNHYSLDIPGFNHNLEKAPIGSGGLILLPFFNGERTPNLPTARASLHGVNGGNFDVENLCRASVEGATFTLKYGLEVLSKNGIVPKQIRLTGGGAKSKAWREILAQTFGCEVICPKIHEAGALGAAIQAIWCYQNQSTKTELTSITQDYVELDRETQFTPNKTEIDQYEDVYQQFLEITYNKYPSLQNG